jgi:hypothetical protein
MSLTAKRSLAGTFVAATNSNALELRGKFNISLFGTFVATVKLQRSFDGGTTWIDVSRDTSGSLASYTAPISFVAEEPEDGVQYRLNCTAFTSGTVSYRLSQNA